LVSYTSPCTLNEFNPAQGTLNSVTLSLTSVSGDVYSIVSDINTTTGYTFSSATATIGLTLAGPDTIDVTDQSTPPCSGSVSASSTFDCADSPFSGLAAAPITGTTANYIGTGTITPVFDASGQIVTQSGSAGPGSAGQVFFSGDGSIGGTFTLTYNYTPPGGVPEPATMAMVGGLFFGLAALARKRRA